MERCRWCRSSDLEQVEYVETNLFDRDVVRVIITYCNTCGGADTTTSRAVPAGA